MRQGFGCFGSFLFLGIFFAVGAGLSWWGWGILQDARVSETWPSSPGQITHSEIDEDRDEDGTSYHADIAFEYAVNDQRYAGDTVNFGQYGGSYGHAEEIVNKYPVGESVQVYYDPNEPTTAVLEPGVSGGSYLVLGIGLCFAGVPFIFGPFMLIGALRGRRN